MRASALAAWLLASSDVARKASGFFDCDECGDDRQKAAIDDGDLTVVGRKFRCTKCGAVVILSVG